MSYQETSVTKKNKMCDLALLKTFAILFLIALAVIIILPTFLIVGTVEKVKLFDVLKNMFNDNYIENLSPLFKANTWIIYTLFSVLAFNILMSFITLFINNVKANKVINHIRFTLSILCFITLAVTLWYKGNLKIEYLFNSTISQLLYASIFFYFANILISNRSKEKAITAGFKVAISALSMVSLGLIVLPFISFGSSHYNGYQALNIPKMFGFVGFNYPEFWTAISGNQVINIFFQIFLGFIAFNFLFSFVAFSKKTEVIDYLRFFITFALGVFLVIYPFYILKSDIIGAMGIVYISASSLILLLLSLIYQTKIRSLAKVENAPLLIESNEEEDVKVEDENAVLQKEDFNDLSAVNVETPEPIKEEVIAEPKSDFVLVTDIPKEVTEEPVIIKEEKKEIITTPNLEEKMVVEVKKQEKVEPIHEYKPLFMTSEATHSTYADKPYDEFFDSLTQDEKEEFDNLFISCVYGTNSKLPVYEIGNANTLFFKKVFIYIGRFRSVISTSLLDKIYKHTMK